jgi:hypothetical protein
LFNKPGVQDEVDLQMLEEEQSKPCFEVNFIAKLVLKVNLVLKPTS